MWQKVLCSQPWKNWIISGEFLPRNLRIVLLWSAIILRYRPSNSNEHHGPDIKISEARKFKQIFSLITPSPSRHRPVSMSKIDAKIAWNVLSNLLSAKDWDKTLLCGALHTRTWLVEIYWWLRAAWLALALAGANLWIQIYQVISILMTCNRCIFSVVAGSGKLLSLSDEMHNPVLLCSMHKCIKLLRPRHKYLSYLPDQFERICV